MADAATMLRELSYPWAPGEYVKTAIGRAASLAKLQYWRAFDIWYRKARKVEDYEIAQIAEALRIKNEKAARNELHELKFRIARLEGLLSNSSDPDFHRPSIDFAGELLRGDGGADRSLAKGRVK